MSFRSIGAQGLPGPKGDKGDQGDPGLSAYAVAVAEGFVGTVEQWLASLEGEQGEQGIQGLKGDPGNDGADLAGIIAAAGDLVVGTGAGTADVLPIGTAGQVLGVVAGTPAWVSGSSGMTLLGYAESGTQQNGVGTSLTDLTGASVTLDPGESELLIVTFAMAQQKSAASPFVRLEIYDSTAAARVKIVDQGAYTADSYVTLSVFARVQPGAGSRTWKLRGATANNTCDHITRGIFVLGAS